MFKNAKTGEVAVGAENRVEQCMYAAVVTRIEEDIDDELTGGWKVIEVGVALALLFGWCQRRGLTGLTCFFLCLSTDGPQIGTRIPIDASSPYSSSKIHGVRPTQPCPLSILLSHSSHLAAPTTHHSDCTSITTTTHSQLGILLNSSNYNTPCSLTLTLSYPSCIRQCNAYSARCSLAFSVPREKTILSTIDMCERLVLISPHPGGCGASPVRDGSN